MEDTQTYTPHQRVALARETGRPRIGDYIEGLMEDFFEQRGDRAFGDDPALVCGIGRFHGVAVTIIGHRKGRTVEESIACRFGMPLPEGYRKLLRALRGAVKFGRPVLTFVDTPGAYPGMGAEERGQGEAIARCLYELSRAPVPILSVITGEGGSGGALALAVADVVLMQENAVYSVLSPEGFASILWKDPARAEEASGVMKLTAADLEGLGIIDGIVPEPRGGAHVNPRLMVARTGEALWQRLPPLQKRSGGQLAAQRYKKFRAMGL